MSLTLLGQLTLAGVLPGVVPALDAGIAGINSALPDILARIAALQASVPTPVDFAAQLTLAQSIVTSIQSAIALALPAPSIDAQIAIVAALIAELEAIASGVRVQLSIVTNFAALLAGGSVALYAYAGQTDAMGAEVTAALAAGLPGGTATTTARALILATIDTATWTRMGLVFRTA